MLSELSFSFGFDHPRVAGLIVQTFLYRRLLLSSFGDLLNCNGSCVFDFSAMPGLAMENSCTLEGPVGNDLPLPKERFSRQMSPRSPLSPDSPLSDSIDLAIDGAMDTSIEQLYHNVCEMQSSDHSPSAPSFLSYGEESRIDSELCRLVGCFGDMEITKEVVVMENGEKNDEGSILTGSSSNDLQKKGSEFTKKNPKILQRSNPSPKKQPANSRPPNGSKNRNIAPRKQTIPPLPSTKLQKANKASGGSDLDNPDLGPFLLKQTRGMVASGENPRKALEFALRAVKCYEKCSDEEKPSLELVMCLHFLAAINCNLGKYTEAIPILERSIDIPVLEEGETHALAKFTGCMQLGDTYAMMGQIENSILCYTAGLEIQRQFLGETDPRVAETCRYVAEAHVQALQFDEAQKLCQVALNIHQESGSIEEAADRRLMGLICDSMGDYESALEHLNLASMAMASNAQELDVAAIDRSIGDAYLSLARYDEAICAYQKALAAFKSAKGEDHPTVALVFVRLADLYNKIGKFKESNSYCENALKIFGKPKPGIRLEEIAGGLVDISAIYQSMNELELAVKLLKKALGIYGNAPGQQNTVAGLEAQVGVMYYMIGNFSDSYDTLKASVSKFRASSENKSALFGITLNQMGLACVQRYAINEAADLFEEARDTLESEYGPYHPDTLGVYSNLAGTYDAMGRYRSSQSKDLSQVSVFLT